MIPKFIGDRVWETLFSKDNPTPFRYGTVINKCLIENEYVYDVEWDDGKVQHGLLEQDIMFATDGW